MSDTRMISFAFSEVKKRVKNGRRKRSISCLRSMVCAFIRWNEEETDEKKIENEIDVIAARGMGQLFISCKTGNPENAALNELVTMTRRFGNRYALPLFVGSKDVRKDFPSFTERARQMGVEVIGRDELDEDKMIRRLKQLCGGWGAAYSEGADWKKA